MKPHVLGFVLHRVLLSIFAAGLLHAQVHAPQAGVVRCVDGSVHPVYGVPGSFVVGPAWSAGATTISFSDQAGLVASTGAIRLLSASGAETGRYATSEAAPVLSVEGDAQSAIAWLPEQQAIIRWNGTSFDRFALPPGSIAGRVASLSVLKKNEAELLVYENGAPTRTTISLGQQSSVRDIETVPGASGPVLAFGSLLLFRDKSGITLESPNGLRRTLPLPPDVAAERMSSHWLHLQSRAARQDWALRLDAAHPELLLLPSVLTSSEQEASR
jgi:hypothetical protein